MGILLMLMNLRHFNFNNSIFWFNGPYYGDLLRTFSRCTFSLQSFEGLWCPSDNIIEFFRQQSSIELLDLDIPGLLTQAWEIPPDTLPCLKYLQTPYYIALPSFCAIRTVTHLDLTITCVGEDELLWVLSTYSDQLVGLKYARHSGRDGVLTPLHALQVTAMCKLKYIEITDHMHDEVRSVTTPVLLQEMTCVFRSGSPPTLRQAVSRAGLVPTSSSIH